MPADWTLTGNDGLVGVHLGLECVSNRPNHHFRRSRRHLANGRDSVPEPLYEQLTIGIQHDLDNVAIVQSNAELVAKRLLKLADEARMRAKLCHGFLLSCLAKRTGDVGAVIGGAEIHECVRIRGQGAGHGHGRPDPSWLADALKRPTDTGEDPFEPKIRHGDDLGEPICHRPLDYPREHGERCLVNRTVSPALSKRGINAKARALDHGGMSVEVTGRKQRGENVRHHRWARCRKKAGTSSQLTHLGDGQNVGRLDIVESIRLTASCHIDFPTQPIGKDTGAQLMMAVEKPGFFGIPGL